MTSSFNCRFGFVFILHVWIISCAKLVNSHEYSVRIINSGLYLYNNDDIYALNDLYSVVFTGQNITKVPVGSLLFLQGLRNPLSIYLINLNVTKLPLTLFSGLITIRMITFERNNKLQSLDHPYLFHGLINLKRISLISNGFTTIPRRQFGNLTNLRHIEISSSPLREVPADLFKGSTNLDYISITNCSLTSVPSALFRGLINLSNVFLDDNKLTELPEDLFHGLEALQRIQINNNQLISLPERIFSNLRNLRILRVENNKLTQLSPNLLKGLELNFVSFYDNQLTSVSNDVFANQPSLDILVLSNNNLTVLPQNVLRLVQVRKAIVDENLKQKYRNFNNTV